jgi:hypothetical protein
MIEAAGAVGGAVFGYLYHRFVGCASGACPIQSNRWISMVYWAVMGGLVASFLTR